MPSNTLTGLCVADGGDIFMGSWIPLLVMVLRMLVSVGIKVMVMVMVRVLVGDGVCLVGMFP